MTTFIMNGAAGRMGTTIIKLAANDPNMTLVGAVDRRDSEHFGKDAGTLAGIDMLGVKITDNIHNVIDNADVIIDFSSPDSTIKLLEAAVPAKKRVIVGTTGHQEKHKKAFLNASKEISLLVSPNMSVGVNLLWKLADLAGKTLGKDYQIDIVERHHIHKKDAPSGTAKKLIEVVSTAAGHDIDEDVFYALDGSDEAASGKPVTVQAIREGEVVGDHTLYFTSKEDRVELAHYAFTRDIFGKGALRAAKWIVDKPTGLYDMQNVLF